MFDFVKILFFIFFVGCLTSEEELSFSTEVELYEFYKNWLESENLETFRNIQVNLTKAIMNITADPCEDFYEYACGNFKSIVPENNTWKNVEITYMMTGLQNHLVKAVLSSEIKSDDSETGIKVKGFFKSCLDNSTWDYEILGDFLKTFASWPLFNNNWSEDNFDWLNLTAYASLYDVHLFFKQSVEDENGVFYNSFDVTYIPKLKDFEVFVEKMKNILRVISVDIEGKEDMLAEVFEFATKLSNLKEEFSYLITEREIYTLSELKEKVSGINFQKYLEILREKRRIPLSTVVLINRPIYFEDLAELLAETNSRAVANYMFLFMAARMILSLQYETISELESLCIKNVNEAMQSAVVALYAKHYFNEDSYTQSVNLVDNIQEAARKVINDSDWIDNETKIKALEKINVITKHVAFSGYILSSNKLNEEYADLHINSNNFMQNIINQKRHIAKRYQLKVGHNNTEFPDDPLIVNAFFLIFDKASLVLPVAILQPPFFNKYNSHFANYGGIGVVAGHELMHGFDVDGFVYGPEGKKSQWWNLRLSLLYYTRIECLYSQYNKYKIESINRTIDGESTLAENQADNEGLRLALIAYKKWLDDNGNPNETTHLELAGLNLTNIQAFFLSYAQANCAVMSHEQLDDQIDSDEHSPSMMRVLGSLSNSVDFAEAYNCPVGSKMNPAAKCRFLRK